MNENLIAGGPKMKLLIKRFPDVCVILLYGVYTIISRLFTGEPIADPNSPLPLYGLGLLIWLRLVMIDYHQGRLDKQFYKED